MSIQCPTCEKKLPDDAHFCRRCGSPQAPPIPSVSQLRNNIASSRSLATSTRRVAIIFLIAGMIFGVIQVVRSSDGNASDALSVVIGIFVCLFLLCFVSWAQQVAHVGRYMMQLERLQRRRT